MQMASARVPATLKRPWEILFSLHFHYLGSSHRTGIFCPLLFETFCLLTMKEVHCPSLFQ